MFIPKKILFLKDAINYPVGRDVYDFFKDRPNVDIKIADTNAIKSYLDNEDFVEFYRQGKKTLVLGVKKVGVFQTCKPSADYQLPLVSGCMGQCEYCYLQTQLRNNPFTKVNVNIDDIFAKAIDYIKEKPDQITSFEGTATSDILPIEPYTKVLARTIKFFATQSQGRFRFVSKFTDVDTLLDIEHNDHTEIRFSINTDTVIKAYEHTTPRAKNRIIAAKKVLDAGYRVGFLIAPVFLYDNYQDDYQNLLKTLKEEISEYQDKISFEIISHRYTSRAKQSIQSVFPETKLDMDDEKRSFRMGQFGYGKFMYTTEELRAMKEFFKKTVSEIFPLSELLYIV